jgi:hypothetical protein
MRGAFTTDGSLTIVPFKQFGDTFLFAASRTDVNTTTPATSLTQWTPSVPQGLNGIEWLGSLLFDKTIAAATGITLAANATSAARSFGINSPAVRLYVAAQHMTDLGKLHYAANVSTDFAAFQWRTAGFRDQGL